MYKIIFLISLNKNFFFENNLISFSIWSNFFSNSSFFSGIDSLLLVICIKFTSIISATEKIGKSLLLFIIKISEEEVITLSDCGNSYYLKNESTNFK